VRKRGGMALLALTLLLGGGADCAKPSRELRMMVEECGQTDQVPRVQEKNPRLALGLGFAFGAGSFYTGQWELGVLGAAAWPLSMAWDPLVGYWGAKQINEQATLEACRKVRVQKRLAQTLPASSSPQAPAP